jgi:nitrile hydratase
MDSVHDLGGKQGFAAVRRQAPGEAGDEAWEKKAFALSSLMVGRGIYNMDEYRHAIERMDPRHYLSAGYYERVFTACASLCIEKGLITESALFERAGGRFALSGKLGPGRPASGSGTTFAIGDAVQVKNEFVSGHTRMPGYIRGKRGVVVGVSPSFPFPDACGHGMPEQWELTYSVRFQSEELWPGSSEQATIHVNIFHTYLQADSVPTAR